MNEINRTVENAELGYRIVIDDYDTFQRSS